MTEREIKNIPASVRARLLNHARASGESYDQVLQYFVIERFLYRLSQTDWGHRLIVKGAIMLRAWGTPLGRPTRDIDFLGHIDRSSDAVVQVIRECLAVDYSDDGLVFDSELDAEEINSGDEYPGVRIVLRGDLDGGVFRLQLDISIDDSIVPDPEWVDYPTLLELDAPRILAYHPTTAIAEKFETIVSRGLGNSRLRDYYDIWLLSRSRAFLGSELAASIAATFAHRETSLSKNVPAGLAAAFYTEPDRRDGWRSFLVNRGIEAPAELSEVCEAIAAFIMPPATAVAEGSSFERTWDSSSGWS